MLEEYLQLLRLWNRRYRFMSRSVQVEKLIAQARMLLAFAKKHCNLNHKISVDIGSGYGMPGMIWAIDGLQNIHFVERSDNRAAFLNYVNFKLNFKHQVHNKDIRKINRADLYNTNNNDLSDKSLLITAQAFSTINFLLTSIEQLIDTNTDIFLLKTSNIDYELQEAKENFDFKAQTEIVKFGTLIWIYNIKKLN